MELRESDSDAMLGFAPPGKGPRRGLGELLSARTGCSVASKCLYSVLLVLCTASACLLLFSANPDLILPPQPHLQLLSCPQPPPPPNTTIFVITPTGSKRHAQKADLTRLSQTLRLVPKLHWVLIEDAAATTPHIATLLRRSQLPFTHLATQEDPSKKKARGMGQRDLGLDWLRKHFKGEDPDNVDAVLYFADDDNAYDIRVFNEYIRHVPQDGVAVWPVGFPSSIFGNQWVETANVVDGHVKSWNTTWNPKREFAADMASFAIHLSLILRYSDARFGGKCSAGNYEPCFLKQLGNLRKEDLSVFGYDGADGEREVFVWHTKTKQNEIALKGSKKGYIV